jgi:hypothetical protein
MINSAEDSSFTSTDGQGQSVGAEEVSCTVRGRDAEWSGCAVRYHLPLSSRISVASICLAATAAEDDSNQTTTPANCDGGQRNLEQRGIQDLSLSYQRYDGSTRVLLMSCRKKITKRRRSRTERLSRHAHNNNSATVSLPSDALLISCLVVSTLAHE